MGRSSEYKFKFKGLTPTQALKLVVDDYLDDSNDFIVVSFYNQIVSSLRFGSTRRQAVLEARDQCWRDDRIQALVRFRQSFDLEVDYVIAAINLGATQAMWTALNEPRRNAT